MSDVARPVARTPLHHWQAAHGARFIERNGWQIAAAYSGADAELAAGQQGLGLADLSAGAKISFRGSGVRDLVPLSLPNGTPLPPLTVAPCPDGTLACRLTEDHALLLASTLGIQLLPSLPIPAGIIQTDVTSAYAGFEIIGPRLEEVLARLCDVDLRLWTFPVSSCRETALAGVEALLIRRELHALQIYVGWELGEYVWERLIEAGRDVRIAPMGAEASSGAGRGLPR